MFLAKTFSAVWQSADAGARAAAAAIATGANAVGQIPVVAAKLENAAEEAAFSGVKSAAQATIEVAKGTAITASEWQGWMDVKSAQVLQTLHLPADVEAQRQEAEERTKSVESACGYLQKAAAGTLSSVHDDLRRAEAQRSQSAQALRSKISAAGVAAGSSLSLGVSDLGKNIASGLKKGDALIVDKLLGGAWAVAGVYSKAKAWFTGEKLADPCQTCQLPQRDPGSQLFAMVAKEKTLIAAAGQKGLSSNPAVLAAESHVDAGNKALMAADVYDDPPKAGQVAPGWTRVGPEELRALHLNPDDFTPNKNDSEFRAALYKYKSDDQPPKYTLAFKGTTMESESDWKNNIRQGLGLESDYYQRAQKLAKKVEYNVGEFEVTGHSLGGGLAAAAAAVTGAKGVTFNAAGLNPETVGAVDGAALNAQLKRQLTNYQVDGEVLTTLQSTQLASEIGLPKAAGVPIPLPAQAGDDRVKKHLMPSVEEGLLDQGTKSETELGQLVGSP